MKKLFHRAKKICTRSAFAVSLTAALIVAPFWGVAEGSDFTDFQQPESSSISSQWDFVAPKGLINDDNKNWMTKKYAEDMINEYQEAAKRLGPVIYLSPRDIKEAIRAMTLATPAGMNPGTAFLDKKVRQAMAEVIAKRASQELSPLKMDKEEIYDMIVKNPLIIPYILAFAKQPLGVLPFGRASLIYADTKAEKESQFIQTTFMRALLDDVIPKPNSLFSMMHLSKCFSEGQLRELSSYAMKHEFAHLMDEKLREHVNRAGYVGEVHSFFSHTFFFGDLNEFMKRKEQLSPAIKESEKTADSTVVESGNIFAINAVINLRSLTSFCGDIDHATQFHLLDMMAEKEGVKPEFPNMTPEEIQQAHDGLMIDINNKLYSVPKEMQLVDQKLLQPTFKDLCQYVEKGFKGNTLNEEAIVKTTVRALEFFSNLNPEILKDFDVDQKTLDRAKAALAVPQGALKKDLLTASPQFSPKTL